MWSLLVVLPHILALILPLQSSDPMSQNETEEQKRERLRKQLNETHKWPCDFTFKFIVPAEGDGEEQLKATFSGDARFSSRASRNGRYVAFTIVDRVHSAEDVFTRYEGAAVIPGVISL